MTDFSNGTITVIGHHFYEHRDPTGGIALIGELFHVVGIVVTGTASNSAIDGIAGHVSTEGFIYRCTQPRIVLNNTTTLLGGHHQFTNQLGKQLAPLGILGGLAMLNVCPLTMPCHDYALRVIPS